LTHDEVETFFHEFVLFFKLKFNYSYIYLLS
jgi:hypothetical protein